MRSTGFHTWWIASSHRTLPLFYCWCMATFLRRWSATTCIAANFFGLSFTITNWRGFPFCRGRFPLPRCTAWFITDRCLWFRIRIWNFSKYMFALPYSRTWRPCQFPCHSYWGKCYSTTDKLGCNHVLFIPCCFPCTLFSPSLSDDFLAAGLGCTLARGPFDLDWLITFPDSVSESEASDDWDIVAFLKLLKTML